MPEDRLIRDADEDREIDVVDLGGDEEEDDDEVTRIDPRHDVDDPEEDLVGEDAAKSDDPEDKKEDDPEEPLTDSAEQKKLQGEKPQLDPELEAQLKDLPEVREAVAAKLAELDTERATLVKEREDFETGSKGLIEISNALDDPARWRDAYDFITKTVAERHGVDPRSLAGAMLAQKPSQEYPFAPGVTEMQEGDKLFERLGYLSETEMHQAKEIQDLKAKHDADLAALRAEVQQLAKGTAQTEAESKKQAELSASVARDLDSVKRHFKSEHQGFNVTESMLKNALAEFPNQPPARAVELAFAGSIRRFEIKEAAKRSQRGPELIPSGQPRGQRSVPAENYSGRDALREIQSQRGE